MRGEEMLEAMGYLDADLLQKAEAAAVRRKGQQALVRMGALAACLAMIWGGMVWLNREKPYTKPQRNIVETFGYIEPMGMMIADVNNYEAITELSSQIVLCRVTERTDTAVTQTGLFSFGYKLEILDILMDVGNRLQIGDTVRMISSEGILKAADAAELVADSPRAKKLGILQGEYTDEDYIISSTWNAIPIEVGNCYLMYLNDDHWEEEGVYTESGRGFLYEYHGQTVYSGREMTKSERTLSEIIGTVDRYIAGRTGRADEIGAAAYMQELGKRQNSRQQ